MFKVKRRPMVMNVFHIGTLMVSPQYPKRRVLLHSLIFEAELLNIFANLTIML